MKKEKIEGLVENSKKHIIKKVISNIIFYTIVIIGVSLGILIGYISKKSIKKVVVMNEDNYYDKEDVIVNIDGTYSNVTYGGFSYDDNSGAGGNSNGGNSGGSGSINTAPVVTNGSGKSTGIKLNGWMLLYDGPTYAGNGYEVDCGESLPRPSGKSVNSWAMKEDKSSQTGNLKFVPSGFHVGSSGEIYDNSGRFYAAVGPNIMYPGIVGKGIKIGRGHMFYGTFADVVITDGSKTYYVPIVVADCKMHTWDTGIVQTGTSCNNTNEKYPQNADGSVVEFCGKAGIGDTKNYRIVKVIVYKEKPAPIW